MTGSVYVLAIDQGTTSTRAMLFDAAGRVRSSAQIELTQHYPQPGWVEHDLEEIWRGVVATCREAAAAADGLIAAIGVANQRETTVVWERATGRPVHNAIVWQDRRTADLCALWRRERLGEAVSRRTGLVIDPYFSASKIRWLLDHVPGLRRRAEDGEATSLDAPPPGRALEGLEAGDRDIDEMAPAVGADEERAWPPLRQRSLRWRRPNSRTLRTQLKRSTCPNGSKPIKRSLGDFLMQPPPPLVAENGTVELTTRSCPSGADVVPDFRTV